jgi:NADPH-dependent curcumin reductase CurA
MDVKINHQWCLSSRPVGLIKESDFVWREVALGKIKEGQVLIRVIYLSIDPTYRGWVRETASYLPPVQIGEVMRGLAIGIIEESRHPEYSSGDLVQGLLGWQEYCIANGEGLTILPKNLPIPLTAHFGLFGHIGLSAYFGLLDIGKPKPGETLVVSAAAGAVGSLTGQIGKISGCRVIGIAGTDKKCQWLTDELGFDAAINYKTESVLKKLKEHCPNGIDIYFDNVGGEILDASLALINLKARIVICGLISQYNAERPVPGPYNFANILVKRARVEGFIVLDYFDRADEAISKLAGWLAEGKIKYRVDIIEGLKNAPEAVNKLFDGSHSGKLMIKVSDEP